MELKAQVNVLPERTALFHRRLNSSSTDEKKGKGAKSTPNVDSASQKGVWDLSENKLVHGGLEPMGATGLSYTTLVRARFS